MKRILLAVMCLIAVSAVVAVDGNDDALARELKLLEEEVARGNKICIKLEHDAVYTNESCMVVYAEVKKLEKQLVERRKILLERLDNVPEIHDARAARKKAYARLQAFKKRTGLLQSKEAK